jgi:hypothetical protein
LAVRIQQEKASELNFGKRIERSASKVKTAFNPSGQLISFDEEKHKYVDSSKTIYNSVTTVIKKQFPEFDAERIAGFVAKKRGCLREDVLNEWEFKRNASSAFGDKIHSYAEFLLQKKEQWEKKDLIIESSDYRDKVDSYCQQLDILIPKLLDFYELLGAEKIIFSPEHKISGTIDLLMRNKRTGQLAIFDWKTNEEIRLKHKTNEKQTGFNFFFKIPDANFYHYQMQLSTYARILEIEKYYDPTEFELAIFHIRKSEIIPYKMEYMKEEADMIMNISKTMEENKNETTLHDNNE